MQRRLLVEPTGRQKWRESGMQRLHHDPNLSPLCTLPYITYKTHRIGVYGCVWSGGGGGKQSHVLVLLWTTTTLLLTFQREE